MARHPLELRKIKFVSKEYQQSLKLREQILRLPLGLKLSAQELARDIDDTHLGGFIGTELVACLVLSRVAPTRMKMRQVAVAENFQGQGVGKSLVQFSEQICIENQIYEIELSARETAINFYLQQAYEPQGESYSEQNIPHIKMSKILKIVMAD